MQIYSVVVLLGFAFVWSPAGAQYGPVQPFLINCEAGLADPDCPDSNITDDTAAYRYFVSKPQLGHRVQREQGEEGSKFLWLNPCHNPPHIFDAKVADQDRTSPESKEKMLTALIVVIDGAKSFANRLKDAFALLVFGITSKELHALWKHTCFYWLPSVEQIPKTLGMDLKWRYLYSILNKENSTLESCYRYLQYYSIAMEKITMDLINNPKGLSSDEKLKNDFVIVEYQLRNVLCELEAVLFEYHLERFIQHYISPLIFPKHALLNLDDTSTAIRDWLIFRDYINFLEYLWEVIDLFQAKVHLRISG